MKDVSIVIVTWSSAGTIGACLDSILRSKDISFEVTVVDNASPDTTVSVAQERPVNVIKLDTNTGYAHAANVGIRASSGRYIFVLNPDTTIREDTLGTLVAYADRHPDVGLISPKILDATGSVQEGSLRRFPTLITLLLLKALRVKSLWTKIPTLRSYMMVDANTEVEQDLEQVMGAAMFMRMSALDAIGLFDERYFIWFEDVDLSKRFYDSKYKTRYLPSAVVEHVGGVSFKKKKARLKKQWWIVSSGTKYLLKHRGIVSALLFILVAPINLGIAWVQDVMSSDDE